MTDHPLTDFMADPERRARLVAAAERAMEEKITEQFKWSLPDVVSAEVNAFLKDHVGPKVREHLISQEGAIVAGVIAATEGIGAQLAEAMVSKVAKTLATDWDFRKVMEALFKS